MTRPTGLENPDYVTMGGGHPIREPDLSRERQRHYVDKRVKVAPRVAAISDYPRLLAALAMRAK